MSKEAYRACVRDSERTRLLSRRATNGNTDLLTLIADVTGLDG